MQPGCVWEERLVLHLETEMMKDKESAGLLGYHHSSKMEYGAWGAVKAGMQPQGATAFILKTPSNMRDYYSSTIRQTADHSMADRGVTVSVPQQAHMPTHQSSNQLA